ncbi:hypothetical protein CROQUDRAFT_692934, partial [Cronartium quercuum f. sp. fusiforme G11]
MNINKKFINNILLLKCTYNHYVHYWYGQKYRWEVKEAGKNQKDDERKNIQACQSKHASDHNFPPRYQKILREIEAHSNDEWSPK